MGRIIGIDLGTTNTVAAFVDGDEPRVMPNDRGSRVTPSVVAFAAGGDTPVGESARNQAVVNAERTVLHVKRSMGKKHVIQVDGVDYSPQQISALILKKVKADTEQFLGGEVREAVISVPAHSSDPQRKAIVEAGRLAGLTVLRIINEPTAAALAYGTRFSGDKRIVVYDLGGETFDATCLQTEELNAGAKQSLGRFLLSGISGGARGEPRIEVCFSVDADGIAHVAALIERILDLKRCAAAILDESFCKEIEDLTAHAVRALERNDIKTVRESSIALETIIDELQLIVAQPETDDASA